jgi:hypothetical protein
LAGSAPRQELISTGPWQEEIRYELLVQVPEVRQRIEQQANQSIKGLTGEEFLALAEKLMATPLPLEQLAKAANQIYRRWGIGTGQSREQTLKPPCGEVLAGVLCSLARQGQPIRQVRQSDTSCQIEAKLPSDMFSLEGDFIITVERRSTNTHVVARTHIGGQLFDWGKSRRALHQLFSNLSLLEHQTPSP